VPAGSIEDRELSPARGWLGVLAAAVVLAFLLGAAEARGTEAVTSSAEQTGPSLAEETVNQEDADSEIGSDRGSRFVFFPAGDPYPPPMAGPLQRGFGILVATLGTNEIAETRDKLLVVKFGGRYGLLEFRPRDGGRGWQLGLEIAVFSEFDFENDFDAIGWDGTYGLSITRALSDRSALKVGVTHVSSHLGDEYSERTGATRQGYTRQELMVGLSRRWRESWRSYAELGWGFDLRDDRTQDPGRGEIGLEYGGSELGSKGRIKWYAAVDASFTEEREWQLDLSLQVGLLFPSADRRWRVAIDFYDGRVPLGEFFLLDQSWVGFGIWLDH